MVMLNRACPALSDRALAQLRWAYRQLKHPSLATRLSSRCAAPVEQALGLLPKGWKKRLNKTDAASIRQSLQLVMACLCSGGITIIETWPHKAAARRVPIAGALSGAWPELIFINHYQKVAGGHASVRRAQRRHAVNPSKENSPPSGEGRGGRREGVQSAGKLATMSTMSPW